jgi:DNA-binding NarL/FixJ family response regulator
MTGVRVLIADDHPVLRDGLRAMLTSTGAAEVVAGAATGQQAVRETTLHHPDVVVMDLAMPGLNGIEATRQTVRANSQVGVLAPTMHHDDDSVFAAMRAGARGYVLKGASQQELVQAIQAVARGEAIVGPAVASRVLATSPAASRPWPSCFQS